MVLIAFRALLLCLAFSLNCFSSVLQAQQWYSQLNFASYYETEKIGTETTNTFSLVSQASRLGIKGKIDTQPDSQKDTAKSALYEVSYQLEYQIDPVSGKTPTQRNSFLLIDTFQLGRWYVGTYDTAMKQSQAKVDVFNDTPYDIKYLVAGEHRVGHSITYKNRHQASGLSGQVTIITNQEDTDSLQDRKPLERRSLALKWTGGKGFIHLASTEHIADYKRINRLTGGINIQGFQFGAIHSSDSKQGDEHWYDLEGQGTVLSLRKGTSGPTIKAQWGKSKRKAVATETYISEDLGSLSEQIELLVLGLDFAVSNKMSWSYLVAFKTTEQSANQTRDWTWGLSLKTKF